MLIGGQNIQFKKVERLGRPGKEPNCDLVEDEFSIPLSEEEKVIFLKEENFKEDN